MNDGSTTHGVCLGATEHVRFLGKRRSVDINATEQLQAHFDVPIMVRKLHQMLRMFTMLLDAFVPGGRNWWQKMAAQLQPGQGHTVYAYFSSPMECVCVC